jgi:hypothetical protein
VQKNAIATLFVMTSSILISNTLFRETMVWNIKIMRKAGKLQPSATTKAKRNAKKIPD